MRGRDGEKERETRRRGRDGDRERETKSTDDFEREIRRQRQRR